MRRADWSKKTLMLGKVEGRKRRGWQRTRVGGWHHQLSGHELEQAPGNGEEKGSLACCTPRFLKELDTTERLNNSNEYHEEWMLTMTNIILNVHMLTSDLDSTFSQKKMCSVTSQLDWLKKINVGIEVNCCLVSKSCLTLLHPHGLQPTRLLFQWEFPDKSTVVGCLFILHVIFWSQRSNL